MSFRIWGIECSSLIRDYSLFSFILYVDSDFQRYQLAGADSTILESWPVLAKNVQKRTLYVSAPIPINASMYDNQYFRGFFMVSSEALKNLLPVNVNYSASRYDRKAYNRIVQNYDEFSIDNFLHNKVEYVVQLLNGYLLQVSNRIILKHAYRTSVCLKQLCVNISKLPTFIAQKAMQNEWIARIVNTIMQVNTG
uniref:Uncharacterized protein n=1 Tax=Spironucleus salmonicida TaxID=348837 RepID=V6LGH1_9EUKA|eukprot:EST42776.1 Hypothetical protein SS50377_17542 [Spironucleus salmonicida]